VIHRFVLASLVLALAILSPGALAWAQSSGNQSCPPSKPSPDGSRILPMPAGRTSCALTDATGVSWRFEGDTLAHSTGGGWNPMARFPNLEINNGGQALMEGSCVGTNYQIWYVNGPAGFVPTLPPPQRLAANPFVNKTQGKSYPSLYALMTSGVRKGDKIEVAPLPPGLAIWASAGRVNVSGVTITLAPGAVIGCSVDEANAVFPFENPNPPTSGVTITGGEIAYARDLSHGQYRGINFGHARNTTIADTYIHDNDFGVESGGDNGTVTLTNVRLDHNGSGINASTTHNIYLGYGGDPADTTHYVIRGGYSVCTNHEGFQVKLRGPSGSIEDYVAAAPSRHGYTDCTESAAVDLSCGGDYTLGGSGHGAGIVLELGPKAQNVGIVRYNQEGKTDNCPKGGWAKSALVIQNCWLISDAPFDAMVVANADPNAKVTVRGCKIVGNGKWRLILGQGVTDGGGNTYYPDRAAAKLAAYPALPPPP